MNKWTRICGKCGYESKKHSSPIPLPHRRVIKCPKCGYKGYYARDI